MFKTRSRQRGFTVTLCVLMLGASRFLAAQAQPAQPEQSAPAPDALGRDSPFGTVTGFSAAVHREDFLVAARYLQVTGRSAREIESLARDLSGLLDGYFTQTLTSLSTAPAGAVADGLEPNRDRLVLTIANNSVDLFLTRVTDQNAGSVWLFSSDSLARVPALRRSAQATWVERVMPAALVSRSFQGVSFAQWVLWAGSILVPLLLFWTLALLAGTLVRRRISEPASRDAFSSWWRGVRWLVVLGLTLLTHLPVQRLLGFSLTFRIAYARTGLVLAVIIGALLIWRLVSVTFHQARVLAMRRGRSDTRSLILLSERVAKVLVVLAAMLGLLTLAGVDPTTALAGLGIGGVALAFGAQKSVENLLGGIFLLTDRALAVGDYCRVSDREGWVEDITLRSVRLRTAEQTLLSVPAGILAQGNIENFSTRSKILVQSVLRLRYGTTGGQLQAVLDSIRQLLAGHPLLEKESARIRLIAFGAQAIELELFAYVTTSDFATFLEVRERLLLQIASLVEASGTAFAGPTQFVHMSDGANGDSPVRFEDERSVSISERPAPGQSGQVRAAGSDRT
jgi:MscS family membrane protein